MVIVFPYVRCIDIGDMHGQLIVVTRMNGKVQYIYLVATMTVDRGVIMQTGGMYEARLEGRPIHTPTNGVTFAYRSVDRVVGLFPYIDMYVINAVVTFLRLVAFLVVTGSGDVIQTAP